MTCAISTGRLCAKPWRLAGPAACAKAAAKRSSARAITKRIGWWWAKRPVNKKTSKASLLSAPRASCPQPPAQRVFIANTLKCRPPRNRNPTLAEVAQCEPFLQRQIELLQPRIILAMGKFAVQSLLRSDEPIGKLRGRVHRYRGVPLVVTYHPAYLLRNLLEKARAWDDLCLAASVVEAAQTA